MTPADGAVSENVSSIDAEAVRRQVDRVAGSRVFAKAKRSQRLLRYLVHAALTRPQQVLKEYTLATEVFDRDPSYDPAVEATVRVEAGRMRSRLREYYHEEGKDDPLVIEVPRGGYAVILTVRESRPERKAPVSVTPDEAELPDVVLVETASAQLEIAGDSGRKETGSALPGRMWTGQRTRWYAAAALICVSLVGYAVWAVSMSEPSRPAVHSLAVLPLRNLSGDAGQEFFADGTTDELITQLARIQGLRVVSWNSALQEKNTSKPLGVIARELRADAIVEGSVARSGDHLRINAQLIDTRTDAHLWAGSFEGSASEAVALEDAAARAIVTHLQTVIPTPGWPAGEHRETTVDPAAHDAYLRGRNEFDKRDGLASEREFQHAIDLDPGYAPAYAGLALALESEALLGEAPTATAVGRALAAASRSLQLDPENGDALIAQGSLESQFLWDWAAARRDLVRGVGLSPGNSFGQMQMAIYFDALGQPGEAIKHMQTAVDLDPLSFYMARHYGSALFYGRHYDEALRQLQYARNMHPASAATVDHWISDAYEKKGMYADAVRYDLLQMQDKGVPVNQERLLATFREKGWRAYWQARLEVERSTEPPGPCRDYEIGLAAVRAGQRDEALAALRSATEQHCYWMIVSRTSPLLDEVRDDPRFGDVLAALHLPVGGPP